jgi:regulator of RNase E activity RraA
MVSNQDMTDDLDVRRLRRLSTTVVSDALDAYGLAPGIGDLQQQWDGPRIAGVARTVELEADPGDAPGPHIATSAIVTANPGDVIVVANKGRTDVSCWGGLLSLGSVQRGLSGVVVDGVCRDVAEARELKFPVFSRGTTPRTARGRLRQKAVGGTIVLAGLTVDDGDLIVADDSGVVVVPLADAERVLDLAEQIERREDGIAEDIRAGATITQAMHDARLAGQQVAANSTSRQKGTLQ